MSNEQLARAFASTRSVLAGVTTDQLGDPTPCMSWDVRSLVNHVVTAPRWGTAAVQGEPYPDEEDFASGDFLASYDETARRAMEAFEVPGALEQTVALPFGEFPGAFVMSMIVTDQFTHGWDLARATGQRTDLDPGLAEQLVADVAVPDHFRGRDGEAPFGPVQEAPGGASAADRLAAYLGRRV